jgi:hypothetical protein
MFSQSESAAAQDARMTPKVSAITEVLVIVALFLFFLASFDIKSAVHGPTEILDQDSSWILSSLAENEPYRWNPQNHILYHVMLESGHGVWQRYFGSGLESTFRYLKLFTALTGLAFLIALRALLCKLGLALGRRVVLLLFVGVSVSIWFHFSAFETHGLALPALAVYLLSLVRLRDTDRRTWFDRLLLIGSLVIIGWTRVDLFRFAAVSVLLPLWPGTRQWWRSLVVDLLLVVSIGLAGNAVLSGLYFESPAREAATRVFDRDEGSTLRESFSRVENLKGSNLLIVGRAVTLYSVVMPVEPRDAKRSFLQPPTYELNSRRLRKQTGRRSAPTGLFLQPARNASGSLLSLLAALGVTLLLLIALGVSLGRAISGDVLHGMLLAHAAAGWLLYTWFNPFEPFLWVVEFLPLWIVSIAELLRRAPRPLWIGMATLTVLIALHNVFAFYLPFR